MRSKDTCGKFAVTSKLCHRLPELGNTLSNDSAYLVVGPQDRRFRQSEFPSQQRLKYLHIMGLIANFVHSGP